MKLWETYFRLWQRVSDSLTVKTTQLELKEKPVQEEERGTNYYGFLCDEWGCVENGKN